jgi:hypothetical protein
VKVENLSVENRLCQLLNMTPKELCLPPGDVVEGEVTENAKNRSRKMRLPKSNKK